jgi:5-methylthioadenosine/S-adenosylhomocysteine deaminase
MPSQDHLIHAKWIITCEEKNNILENHALVIHQGTIKDILPAKKALELYPDASKEDYTSHAIMPGFVNAHTHIPMNYFRGLADDLKLMDWLQNHIWPAEKKWLSAEFVYDASLFAIAEMLRSGTTCFNDMFFFMPAIADAINISKIRGSVGLHIISFPTNWAKDAKEEFEKGLEFLHAYKNHPLLGITLAPHSMYTVTEDEYLLKVKEIAEEHNLQINMHVQEPQEEINIVLKKSNLRPFERLQKLGLLTKRLIAIHALHLNEDDLNLIEACKPNIVHCPESNMKLASGICPVTELLRRGVNVALGSDSTASNNDLNMLGEMRTAAFLAKHHTSDSESLPAPKNLQMATLNGAKALGMDHIIGSLSQGKSADFIAIHLDEIETLPLYHPASQIVYAASRHQVTDVWVAGKQLLKNRKLQTLDEKELIAKAHYWGEKIRNGE